MLSNVSTENVNTLDRVRFGMNNDVLYLGVRHADYMPGPGMRAQPIEGPSVSNEGSRRSTQPTARKPEQPKPKPKPKASTTTGGNTASTPPSTEQTLLDMLLALLGGGGGAGQGGIGLPNYGLPYQGQASGGGNPTAGLIILIVLAVGGYYIWTHYKGKIAKKEGATA